MNAARENWLLYYYGRNGKLIVATFENLIHGMEPGGPSACYVLGMVDSCGNLLVNLARI